MDDDKQPTDRPLPGESPAGQNNPVGGGINPNAPVPPGTRPAAQPEEGEPEGGAGE